MCPDLHSTNVRESVAVELGRFLALRNVNAAVIILFHVKHLFGPTKQRPKTCGSDPLIDMNLVTAKEGNLELSEVHARLHACNIYLTPRAGLEAQG